MYRKYLPDPGYDKDGLFLIHLHRMSGKQPLHYSLSLPAEEEKINMAKQAMKISDFSECEMNQYGGPLDLLKAYLPIVKDVESLNEFTKHLKEWVLTEENQNLHTLMAALEAECPRNMEEAEQVVGDLSRYQIFEGIKSPEEYARLKLETDGSVFAASICRDYLDWNGLGEALLKRDGAMMTKHGLVTCDDWCCARSTDNLVVTRLFSRLAGTFEDEDGDRSSFSAFDLAAYEYNIRKAIKGDFIQEVSKGLAEYLGNQLLKQRVISMFPSVETYRHELWGVLEVKSWGELLPEEWEFIREEWAGQAADGWGEGFEQTEIDCGEGGILNVHFYTRDMVIQTEQELKGIVEEQPEIQMGGIT